MANVQISGMGAVFAALDQKVAALQTRADQAVQAAGIVCEAEAKKKAPVGTPESTGIPGYKGGRLRSSIKYTNKGPLQCIVFTNVYYAPFVEFGTVKMRARPFLHPAYLIARQQLLAELKGIAR